MLLDVTSRYGRLHKTVETIERKDEMKKSDAGVTQGGFRPPDRKYKLETHGPLKPPGHCWLFRCQGFAVAMAPARKCNIAVAIWGDPGEGGNLRAALDWQQAAIMAMQGTEGGPCL